ncbi:MAG: transcription antitermination factor NusB [Firmicutes bacterium HGW-Firmicutes-14]|nr:MAG: transcription antitermination factor NusB [Firmicutes bacterium HGW-Firmicutes-14]
MSRRAAREAALQALYQMEIGKVKEETAIAFVVEENILNEKQEKFVRGIVSGVLQNMDRLNGIIRETAIEWNLERMAVVDRNIIRIALFEICYSDDVPPNVAVNEAIEMGKTFSTAESGKFINGILGKVLSSLQDYRVGVK